VTGLLLILLTAVPAEDRAPGLELPPEHRGEIMATLALRVPEQGAGPGRGRVQLTIHVHGPAGFEVDGPQLEDALAGWQIRSAASSWSSADGADDWEETLELVQVKPGVVPLPGVTLRVRAGASGSWEEIGWPDLLNEPRDVPGPEKLPPLPPSPWPRVLLLIAVALTAGAGLALLVRAGRRWRAAGERPLPVHERALARLDAMPEEAPAAVVHLDIVLRGYLEERFGVEALRQTTREVLSALAEKNALSGEQMKDLTDLLQWCDVAKFAGGADVAEVRDARERTRQFVRTTAPGEKERDTEEGKPGENQIPGQGG
jgi:hypothetical protein